MRLLELRTILVATDLTATSDAAVRTALALSRASGTVLHVVHVVPGTDDEGRRTHYLSSLDDQLRALGASKGDFASHVAFGERASSIGEYSNKIEADVVILGRRQTNARVMHDASLGGTALAVLSRSRALCLAVAEPLTVPISKAVVAIDRSESARAALLVALSWVSMLRTPDAEPPTLTALYVDAGADTPGETVEPKTIEHELSILRRNAGAWAGVTVLGETVEAKDPARAIEQYVRENGSELVILGTRRPEHREVGLGSVSATLASRLATPVLLVPPAVWRNHTKDVDYF